MKAIKLDLPAAGLTPEELTIAKGILRTRGPRKGCLRVSRPGLEMCRGQTAYIWHSLVFVLSDDARHASPPGTTVRGYLHGPPGRRQLSDKDRGRVARRLDDIATRVLITVPESEWYVGGRGTGKAPGVPNRQGAGTTERQTSQERATELAGRLRSLNLVPVNRDDSRDDLLKEVLAEALSGTWWDGHRAGVAIMEKAIGGRQ